MKTKLIYPFSKEQWIAPLAALALIGAAAGGLADPQLSSWFTAEPAVWAAVVS